MRPIIDTGSTNERGWLTPKRSKVSTAASSPNLPSILDVTSSPLKARDLNGDMKEHEDDAETVQSMDLKASSSPNNTTNTNGKSSPRHDWLESWSRESQVPEGQRATYPGYKEMKGTFETHPIIWNSAANI